VEMQAIGSESAGHAAEAEPVAVVEEAKAEEVAVSVDEEKEKEELQKHLLEAHGGAGAEFVKSIVFGGLDGIITTFAIVAAVAGAQLSTEVIIMMGFSNLIADAISMGVGDYLSSKAENEYIMFERSKEARECVEDIDGERNEMIGIYMQKGFTKEDATTVMTVLTKEPYREFFIDHMMIQELGKQVPDEDDDPAKDGFVTFLSFICFGSVPMWLFVIAHLSDWTDMDTLFGIACGLTAITMFALGAFKAQLTSQPRLKSGGLMMFNGVLAAASAYLVGWGLETLLDVRDNCVA